MYYNPYLQQQYQQPMYQQPQFAQPPQLTQNAPQQAMNQFQNGNSSTQDERIWVQGEEAAKAYLVAPNSFVRLWDSTAQVFYDKRADAMGKPSMVVYEYAVKGSTEANSEQNLNTPTIDYGEQIDALITKIKALEERMAEYESESYDDDTTVYPVQEPIQRRSQSRSAKTGSTRKD